MTVATATVALPNNQNRVGLTTAEQLAFLNVNAQITKGLGKQSGIEYALQTDIKTLLIMDDALARKQALRRELLVVGTAALLFAAQRKELIADAEALIAKLNRVGYRISAAVIAQLKNTFENRLTKFLRLAVSLQNALSNQLPIMKHS